jgi:hypothetical protein
MTVALVGRELGFGGSTGTSSTINCAVLTTPVLSSVIRKATTTDFATGSEVKMCPISFGGSPFPLFTTVPFTDSSHFAITGGAFFADPVSRVPSENTAFPRASDDRNASVGITVKVDGG